MPNRNIKWKIDKWLKGVWTVSAIIFLYSWFHYLIWMKDVKKVN